MKFLKRKIIFHLRVAVNVIVGIENNQNGEKYVFSPCHARGTTLLSPHKESNLSPQGGIRIFFFVPRS